MHSPEFFLILGASNLKTVQIMENKLNKDDSKYLKTALRLLRQGNSMLLNISERSEIDVVSSVTQDVHNDIERSLSKVNGIEDYIAAGKYVQLSFDF